MSQIFLFVPGLNIPPLLAVTGGAQRRHAPLRRAVCAALERKLEKKILRILCLCLPLLLGGCDSVGSVFSGDGDEERIEGERIPVLSGKNQLHPSDSLSGAPVSLPEPITPKIWPQEGGNLRHLAGHIAVTGQLTDINSASIGEGDGWKHRLIPAPVVSETAILAMDAGGHITAHDRSDPDSVLWETSVRIRDDGNGAGGGLAYAEDTLYVTSPSGLVVALDAETGSRLWEKSLKTPVRSAPRVARGRVLVVTADSQLFALDSSTGGMVWHHRGIRETTSLLGTVIPAIASGTVVTPYSSGEIYALSLRDGQPLWTDSLLLPQRTSALGAFTGIGGNPLIAGNVAFTVSHNGLLAANDLRNGLRVWERPLSSGTTPWIAGDYLFVLSNARQLVAIFRRDGRVKWVTDVPSEDEDRTSVLKGPYLVNGLLYILDENGELYGFSPQDGALARTDDFLDDAISAPAFAGGAMYVVGQDATLYEIR